MKKTLMNLVNSPNKVGIFYKSAAWADKVFRELMAESDIDVVNRFINGRERVIYFKDGGFVRMVNVDDRAKGCKFNKIIMEDGIDKEACESIVYPCLAHNNVVVLKDWI